MADAALVPYTENALDHRGIREATKGAFDAIRLRIDEEVGKRRKERLEALGDSKLTSSDVAELVRDSQGTAEVMRDIARGFTDLAVYMEQTIEEEVNATGDHRVVVGDENTQIVAGYKRGSKTEAVADAVIEALVGRYTETLVGVIDDETEMKMLVQAFREGIAAILEVGTVTWRTTAITAAAKVLQSKGLDALGSQFERALFEKKNDPKFTVAREAIKEKRRS